MYSNIVIFILCPDMAVNNLENDISLNLFGVRYIE